ncbi:MAG TPA: VOC family protein [Anaeromyxobacter sp.]|nr:VOC family protein [Anaeromyxobacter sp.]
MLKQSPVTTILPVVDTDRARRFYEEVLGLEEERRLPDGSVVLRAGGSAIELSRRARAVPSPYTVASFEVRDISREVNDLEARGVHFEDYDLPDLKTDRHVCVLGSERADWFKDPDGNILCLHEQAGV